MNDVATTRQLVEVVKRKLSAAAREERRLQTADERSQYMLAFWASLSREEVTAWRLYVLAPGHKHWWDSLTAIEQIEHIDKLAAVSKANSKKHSAFLKRMWAQATPAWRQTRAARISASYRAHFTAAERSEKARAALRVRYARRRVTA